MIHSVHADAETTESNEREKKNSAGFVNKLPKHKWNGETGNIKLWI